MPNFPNSYDNDASLFVAVNNKRTQLTSPITSGTTTIPVISTAGFPDSGYITILTGSDITQAEAILYSSTAPTTFTASQRGAGGTTAAAHNLGDNVDLTIVSAHHNELKDAIINLQYFVGISGGEAWPMTLQDAYDNGDGSIALDGNPITITGTDGVFFNTDYVNVSGCLCTNNIAPALDDVFDIGAEGNHFRTMYLGNNNGEALIFESAISKGAATNYTFNLGGGDSGAGYLNSFLFKMEDAPLVSNAQNSMIFDLGVSPAIGTGANSVSFRSEMPTLGLLTLDVIFYSPIGGQGNDMGFRLTNPGSTGNIAYNLTFNNNTEPGKFAHGGVSSKQINFQFDGDDVAIFDEENSAAALFKLTPRSSATGRNVTANNWAAFLVDNSGGTQLGDSNTTMASAWIKEPKLDLNGKTLTNAATLYVQDAPTEGTTINAAIWAPSGWSIFDRLQAVSGTYTTALAVSGTPVHAGSNLSVGRITAVSGTYSTSLTVSGVPVVTAITFPRKGTKSFTTPLVGAPGGTQTGTETGFANRALVRKLVVTPQFGTMTSTIIEVFKTTSFAQADLAYQATSSGTYTDNDTWFYEDEEGGAGLHWKITNNSATAGTYDFELVQEEFA